MSGELRELVRREAERYSQDMQREIEQLKQRVSELESLQPAAVLKQRKSELESLQPALESLQPGAVLTARSLESKSSHATNKTASSRRSLRGDYNGDEEDSDSGEEEDSEKYEARLAMIEKVEKMEADRGLPESLYNYCIETLARSSDPWRDPALSYLLLFFFVQQTFLISFTQSLVATHFEQHFRASNALPADISICLYRTASIWENPILNWFACSVAILLVAAEIKRDDDETLNTVYPSRDKNASVWALGLFAWFVNSIFTPGVFAIESVGLFVSSANNLEVVCNTLAVTFIMELDNMLYVYLLDDEQKAEYQDHQFDRKKNPAKDWCARSMFFTNLIIMLIMMFYLRFMDTFHGARFANLEVERATVYVLICGLRGSLQIQMWKEADGAAMQDAQTKRCRKKLRQLYAFLPIGVAGAFSYVCSWGITTFEWPGPGILLKCMK